MNFAIQGLDHVVLRVADVERALRFYCEEYEYVSGVYTSQISSHVVFCFVQKYICQATSICVRQQPDSPCFTVVSFGFPFVVVSFATTVILLSFQI